MLFLVGQWLIVNRPLCARGWSWPGVCGQWYRSGIAQGSTDRWRRFTCLMHYNIDRI